MKLWKKIWSGVRALFRKEHLDREMDEEMRSHIELRTQANIAAGMSPQQARYAALRSFGGMERVNDYSRRWRLAPMVIQSSAGRMTTGQVAKPDNRCR